MTDQAAVDCRQPASKLATGIDLIEIDRIAATVRRFDQRFLERIYTERERRYCGARVERLAGRFAVKEAVSKVLGIGIRRIRWKDIEVLPNREGKPEVHLHGSAKLAAEARMIHEVSVSITHSRGLAAAMAVGLQGGRRFENEDHAAGNRQPETGLQKPEPGSTHLGSRRTRCHP